MLSGDVMTWRDRCRVYLPTILKTAALLITFLVLFFMVMIFYVARADSPIHIDIDAHARLPDTSSWERDSKGIPLVIHQMWKDEHIPESWLRTQRECLNLNKEYTLVMWTDKSLYNFIYQKYSWFYYLFISYKYHIQRVDASRYFLLDYYGGVYLDVDVECRTPFRKILANMTTKETTYLVEARITGVTNSFMAAPPHSEFFKYAIHQLPVYAHGFFSLLRHTTIIFSTGPQFLSRCVQSFSGREQIHIMPLNDFYNRHFRNYQAGTWHSWDTEVVELVQFHYIEILLIFASILGLVVLYKKCINRFFSGIHTK